MSTECKICEGTGNEPGELGCVWCDETGKAGGLNPAPSGELAAFRAYMAANPMATYWSVWQERAKISTAELEQYQARRRQFADEVNGRLTALDERADGFEQRIARLRHVGMELTGVIDEYRAMPCDSLKVRMFSTADRYRKRLMAKCGNCEDHGVIGYTTGQTPETFDMGEYPCPECRPTEYAAWSKP